MVLSAAMVNRNMKILVKVDAPVEAAQEVKELLAMKLEGVGKVTILKIEDDGFGHQIEMKG